MPSIDAAVITLSAKRYLVLHPFTVTLPTEGPHGPFLPGDEPLLTDDVAEAVRNQCPHCITEMHPKTKTDWDE